MEFSRMLIFARAKLNMSQTQIAEHLGVSFVTINRWENQITKPSKVAMIRVVEFCKKNGIEIEVDND